MPFAELVRLVNALRDRKVDVEQLIFPNQIHDFLTHRHWVEAYQATADFSARKLPCGRNTADMQAEAKRKRNTAAITPLRSQW